MAELRAPMIFPEDWSSFGPKMVALDGRERRFVWAYLINAMHDGRPNGAQSARDAGYSDASGGCKVQAHALLHRDRVLDAMQEVAARELRGLAIPAVVALARLVSKPDHADHRKSIDMVLARVAPVTTEHKVTVEHRQPKQMVELAARLAAELGVDAQRLIGVNAAAAPILDGEYVEVPGASASDG